MAAASRIAFEVRGGSLVHCAFLTDGGNPAIRNQESADVLTRLGVDPARIFFIGSDERIPDGTLPEHLDRALDALEQRMSGVELDAIYCLAWEGGHQDHDASHLAAIAFARRHGIIDRCFELPLYRASALRPFFRVFSPVGSDWEVRRLTFSEGVRLSLLAWRYRSQRRSVLGLFPGAFFKVAVLRREVIRRVDPLRITRPHTGALLYERRFGYPHERFMKAVAAFVEEHLPH